MHSVAADLSEKLVVNFVTEANYYPFEYIENSEIHGFDIDIAKAVCDRANLHCMFNTQKFDSLLLTLKFGRFDAVIAALDITEERQKEIDFSNPYYQSTPVFVGRASSQNKPSIVGKFIGVLSASSNHRYLIEHAKKESFIIAYRSSAQAFIDLSHGVIDYVFADQAVADNFLLKPENRATFSRTETAQLSLQNFSSGYGIAVKKGNKKLLNRINYGIKKIQEDGSYQQILNRYFSHQLESD